MHGIIQIYIYYGILWIRFSHLAGLINFKDLLADVLKQEKPELPVDYELINA